MFIDFIPLITCLLTLSSDIQMTTDPVSVTARCQIQLLERHISGQAYYSLGRFQKKWPVPLRLALVLSHLGFEAGELSSDVRMKRKKTLAKLRSGALQVLVCSDALGEKQVIMK